MSVTKSGESGKDCNSAVVQKDKRARTCDCTVTHASSFEFYSFRNWEPVDHD